MTKVTFSLPEQLLKDLDNYIEKNSLQRSELLRHLIRIEIYHEKSLEVTRNGKMEKKQ